MSLFWHDGSCCGDEQLLEIAAKPQYNSRKISTLVHYVAISLYRNSPFSANKYIRLNENKYIKSIKCK